MNLDALMKTWRGPLTGFLAASGVGLGEAQDLVHDVFAEAYLGRERFRGAWTDGAAVGAFLRGIARNLLRSRRRAARRAPGSLTEEPSAGSPAAPHDDVLVAIATLEPAHREVIWMFYFQETSTREVAHLLGISERAVEGRLYKARAALRPRLAPGREEVTG
ncbi:MAG: sigma-70 family RNA polymerase sigma factor [Planctomycetota bacterium]